jgi:membrane-bound lytic murein transglycosylase D
VDKKYRIWVWILPLWMLLLSGCLSSHFPRMVNDKAHFLGLVPLPTDNLWVQVRRDFSFDSVKELNLQLRIVEMQRHKQQLIKNIKLAEPYLYEIYQQIKAQNLPSELMLIPFVESSFDPFAYSFVGAGGLWQMMPGTASGFGLKINWWYDGRRDVVASTAAALQYFKYLHAQFGDWLLAIAAYDAGEGRVRRAIQDNRNHNLPTDFWSLRLPRETQEYVPKLLAIRQIIKHPSRYQIELPEIKSQPTFQTLHLDRQWDFKTLAKMAGTSEKIIRRYNPAFRRWAMDPKGPYTLILPIDKVSYFQNSYQALSNKIRAKHSVMWDRYKVVSGDNLWNIAKSYGIKIQALKTVNHLQDAPLKPGKILLIPRWDQQIAPSTHPMQQAISGDRLPGPRRIEHWIQKGDSLEKIARKYKVGPGMIAYWNQLTVKSMLHVGRPLVIWQHKKPINRTYTVRSGDTLSHIAMRYATTITMLRNRNHIQGNNIKIGQVLLVE